VVTVQNSVATPTWRPGSTHPCCNGNLLPTLATLVHRGLSFGDETKSKLAIVNVDWPGLVVTKHPKRRSHITSTSRDPQQLPSELSWN